MEALFVACVIATVAWLFIYRPKNRDAEKRSEPRQRRSEGSSQLVVGQPSFSLAGNGSYSFPVVGEAHYQGALRRIAGAETAKGKSHECDAVLVHQPTNKHDRNACAVTIGGELVGYLPRNEAKEAVAFIKARGLAEGFSVACKAIIKGGWIAKDGYKGNYGVDLDIDTSDFPASAIQKEMIRYLGQKAPHGLSRGQASAIRTQAELDGDGRYVQWVALEEIIKHLHSEDGRDEFFEINKPSIKAIREAFEHFLNEGKSPVQIRDELAELVEHMIDQNPSLEK